MMNKIGQSALEYMMVVGITLAVIVPTTYIFFRYSAETNTQLADSQLNQVGRAMIDTAETVFFSGEDSTLVIDLNMPAGVHNVTILNNRELVFEIFTAIGDNEMVFFSDVNISSRLCESDSCSLSELAGSGNKKIRFTSQAGGKTVNITGAT